MIQFDQYFSTGLKPPTSYFLQRESCHIWNMGLWIALHLLSLASHTFLKDCCVIRMIPFGCDDMDIDT